MSLASHNLSSPALPDAMQISRESEQNLSVSCLNRLPLAFADNCRIQGSGSGFFANARNTLITGGTFVSLSRGLYKQFIIVHIFLPEQCQYSSLQHWGKACEDPSTSKTKLQFTVCWTERHT